MWVLELLLSVMVFLFFGVLAFALFFQAVSICFVHHCVVLCVGDVLSFSCVTEFCVPVWCYAVRGVPGIFGTRSGAFICTLTHALHLIYVGLGDRNYVITLVCMTPPQDVTRGGAQIHNTPSRKKILTPTKCKLSKYKTIQNRTR